MKLLKNDTTGSFSASATNTLITRKFTVNKTWDDTDNTARRNSIFYLKDASGNLFGKATYSANGTVSASENAEIFVPDGTDAAKTSFNWIAPVYDIKGKAVSYTITETANGYSSSIGTAGESYGTSETSVLESVLDVTNTQVSMTLSKVDENGEPLIGAKFTITGDMVSDDGSKVENT